MRDRVQQPRSHVSTQKFIQSIMSANGGENDMQVEVQASIEEMTDCLRDLVIAHTTAIVAVPPAAPNTPPNQEDRVVENPGEIVEIDLPGPPPGSPCALWGIYSKMWYVRYAP